MTVIAPRAQLCIWTNIDPAFEADFNRWYDREHMQERVAIPGFRFARRFKALHDCARPYLALYCTRDAAVFTSEPYAQAFQHQTEWSLRNFARMQGTQRRVGTLDVEAGEGQGGVLAAFVLTPAALAQARPRLDTQLDELTRGDGIVRATLQVTVPALSVSLTAKDAALPPADAVVLIEGTDPDAVRTAAETLAAAHGVPAAGVTCFAMLWRLGANDD
ncbi:hypothetical protein AB870_07390 [Pandoraea faecigallinarum]|uniref:Sugar ABC transporter n=1 Tax=Pandoraea faecigallinarum TaxID=656179 RepID=A0A0H3WQT2_9BURK|nr:DUF4286 family protein [Pandoraea faecigallinarum]AKM29965.1 hypothetical protein AB870_07390 [Pandoraea faecigallinarum]